VVHLVARHRVRQCAHHVLLADHVGEGTWPVAAVERRTC
jgi:hypothetical protein